MEDSIYIMKLNQLEKFFEKHNFLKTYSNISVKEKSFIRRMIEEFCSDYDENYDESEIVVYIQNNYFSYSDLEYWEDNCNDNEYEFCEVYDIRNMGDCFYKNNNIVNY